MQNTRLRTILNGENRAADRNTFGWTVMVKDVGALLFWFFFKLDENHILVECGWDGCWWAVVNFGNLHTFTWRCSIGSRLAAAGNTMMQSMNKFVCWIFFSFRYERRTRCRTMHATDVLAFDVLICCSIECHVSRHVCCLIGVYAKRRKNQNGKCTRGQSVVNKTLANEWMLYLGNETIVKIVFNVASTQICTTNAQSRNAKLGINKKDIRTAQLIRF